MTEAQINRDEALQEAFEAFKEARAEAQKDLDEGLAEALETLQDALLEAQKDYEKAIDDINKSTMKKLTDLKDKLKEVAAEMAAISKGSASGVLSGAPTYKPILAQSMPGGSQTGATNTYGTGPVNVSQTYNVANLDPSDVHMATLSAIKYGQAITVPSTNKIAKPMMTVGAYDK
jgi:tetratricopeptide (TPR) repeat protein